jgi:hypothetical protein
MGAVLQAIQGVCQQAGCALLVVTHWNKTGDGRGPDRIAGAAPAAWARIICSVAVHYRSSHPDGASTVLLGCELISAEIADTRFRLRRCGGADDSADLGSPLSYAVEVLAADDDHEGLDPAAAALSKSRQWVLTALRAGGDMQTGRQLGDRPPREATRSSHAPSRPPSPSSKPPTWQRGARRAAAGPATGHPPRTWMPTAPATANRAMVGGPWRDPPGIVLDRGLAEPARGTSHGALVASSSLTSERYQGRKVLTSAAHHHEDQRPLCDAVRVVGVTEALLGAVAASR